jgi:DNA-binding PadR family transcriptional regulator
MTTKADDELTEENFEETLRELVEKGLVAVSRREDGERVFFLTGLGKATLKNDGVIPSVYLREDN